MCPPLLRVLQPPSLTSSSTKSASPISPQACRKASGPPRGWSSFISLESTPLIATVPNSTRCSPSTLMPPSIAAPARPGTQERPFARTAARHPDSAQGQHRNERPHQHHRRIARARRLARSPGCHSSPHTCAPPALSFWAKPISANGPTSVPRIPPADGAGAAAKPSVPTRWIAIRPAPAPARAPLPPAVCAPPRSAARPMDRSPALHPSMAWPASSPPSDSSAAPASSRSRPARTPAGPMARTVRDLAILLSAMTGVDPQDPATAASQGKIRARLHAFPRSQRACVERASASRANSSRTMRPWMLS